MVVVDKGGNKLVASQQILTEKAQTASSSLHRTFYRILQDLKMVPTDLHSQKLVGIAGEKGLQ